MHYEPTWESLRQHQAPVWFNDAKLGIFVHWGLYSIPGWAPVTGPLPEVVAAEGWQGWFRRNPYAEWYMNSIRIPDSPSAAYHAAQFGADFGYEQFAPQFNNGVAGWDPAAWAELFAAAGARYVVLTTKHHDGFLLWPSKQPNPHRQNYHSSRDLVGDLTAAVRDRGMRMGLYYSGGVDWTFNDQIVTDLPDLFRAVPQSAEYIAYADGHFRELIERYSPAVLWNDIGYPSEANLPQLFADYYNSVTDGVINDRFTQGRSGRTTHFDFRTPEYAVFDEIKQEKWESCRGLGFSFGYNRNESAASMLSADELVRSFVDIVIKNGNLLINVGPTGTGHIPAEQELLLRALGGWLAVNGEAIFGSRPWQRAEGRTQDGTPLRFTLGQDALYALLLGTPAGREVTIEGLAPEPSARVELLGGGAVPWEQRGPDVMVRLPIALPESPAHTLRITPAVGRT